MWVAADDAAVLHLVNPIARFGDGRIMGNKKQRLVPAVAPDPAKDQRRVCELLSVEISSRFVGQNDARIVGQGPCDRHPLLFAAGKMTARTS